MRRRTLYGIGTIIAVCAAVDRFEFEGLQNIMNEYGKTFDIFIKTERINDVGGFAAGENDRCSVIKRVSHLYNI